MQVKTKNDSQSSSKSSSDHRNRRGRSAALEEYFQTILAPDLEDVRQERIAKDFDLFVTSTRIIQCVQIAVFLLTVASVLFLQAVIAYAVFGGFLASLGGVSAAVAVALLSGAFISSTAILLFLLGSAFKASGKRFKHHNPTPNILSNVVYDKQFLFEQE